MSKKKPAATRKNSKKPEEAVDPPSKEVAWAKAMLPAISISEGLDPANPFLKRREELANRVCEVKQLLSAADDQSLLTARPSAQSAGGQAREEDRLVDDGLYGVRITSYPSISRSVDSKGKKVSLAEDFYNSYSNTDPTTNQKTLLATELVRTATKRPSLVASRQGEWTLQIMPPFEQVLDEAIKVLKDEGRPVSDRMAAKLLLEKLVALLDPEWNLRGLMRDEVAFYCGCLWEQLQQEVGQKLANGPKKGHKNSAEARNKSAQRLDAYLKEKTRCEEVREHFVIRDTCTKIAITELKGDKKYEALSDDGKRTRKKSRAKQVEKDLRATYRELFKKEERPRDFCN